MMIVPPINNTINAIVTFESFSEVISNTAKLANTLLNTNMAVLLPYIILCMVVTSSSMMSHHIC